MSLTCFAQADDTSKDVTFISGQRSKTSDDIEFKNFQILYDSAPIDLFWPYKTQNSKQRPFGLEAQRFEINGPNISFSNTLIATRKGLFLGPNTWLNTQVGYFYLDAEGSSDLQKIQAKLDFKYKYLEKLFLSATADRGFLFSSVIPLNGTPVIFYGTQVDAKVMYRFLESFDLSANHRALFFEDNNQGHKNEIQLMYALARFPHWILVGLGGEVLSFNNNSPNYWSPRQFRAWGPRVDISYLIQPKLNYFLGGSYNFFKEDNFPSGTGFYGRTGFQLGDRDDWTISAFLERNESTQNGQMWFNDSFGLVWNKIW